MTGLSYDVVGIGNAIVDVLARSNDGFLADNDLPKGAVTLINRDRADRLYAACVATCHPVERSGGSAANTVATLASLGADTAFIGKVGNDALGERFRHTLRDEGVVFDTPSAGAGVPTARSLIFVTPDAQRTMNTFLGASTDFGADDLDSWLIASSAITYLEGYLWDRPAARQAFVRAAEMAHVAGNRVALSLSDMFCVDRHREGFIDLVAGHVDLLFANEEEIVALYQTSSFDEALQRVRGQCEVAALTRSERGSVVLSGDEIYVLDAEPVTSVIDTTGAGDAYAAGFLYGVSRNLGLEAAGRIGGIVAAEVICHIGARPTQPLGALVAGRVGHHI